MADRVILPLAGIGLLVLDGATYAAALAEGAKLLTGQQSAPGHAADEPLLSSEELAAALSIPPSWLDQKAREGAIPSLEFGRWRRFRRSEVEAAVRGLRA